jgi:TetR/AcrR family transcriptional regulator, ethionamide resistance regulator
VKRVAAGGSAFAASVIVVRRSQRAGRVRADLDAKHTAGLLANMVERTISLHCQQAGPEEDPAVAKALARSVRLTVYG